MTLPATTEPTTDPTPIFEHFRGSHGSELLTIAVAHYDIFGRLSKTPLTLADLGKALSLQQRPMVVLVTALRAMGLLDEVDGKLTVSALAREHLVPGASFDVGDYVGLAAQSPGVLAMLNLLQTNRPLGTNEEAGTAFIYRDGIESAMEKEESARHFTMALAGRAKNVAPKLASAIPADEINVLLDVGCGTGIYSYAMLQRNPNLKAILFDRPEVLKIASEMAEQYGVNDRVQFVAGDMFSDDLPSGADAILLSNILHDWDVQTCKDLVATCGKLLPAGGRLFVHDVFLNDELDGPLPIALYSASLFSFTEGRAYSAAEYKDWIEAAGLPPSAMAPTMVHCQVLTAEKPAAPVESSKR